MATLPGQFQDDQILHASSMELIRAYLRNSLAYRATAAGQLLISTGPGNAAGDNTQLLSIPQSGSGLLRFTNGVPSLQDLNLINGVVQSDTGFIPNSRLNLHTWAFSNSPQIPASALPGAQGINLTSLWSVSNYRIPVGSPAYPSGTWRRLPFQLPAQTSGVLAMRFVLAGSQPERSQLTFFLRSDMDVHAERGSIGTVRDDILSISVAAERVSNRVYISLDTQRNLLWFDEAQGGTAKTYTKIDLWEVTNATVSGRLLPDIATEDEMRAGTERTMRQMSPYLVRLATQAVTVDQTARDQAAANLASITTVAAAVTALQNAASDDLTFADLWPLLEPYAFRSLPTRTFPATRFGDGTISESKLTEQVRRKLNETSTGGLATVNTDDTISGDGSQASPLSVANPFTSADESKLDGIEENATADQSGPEIRDALQGLTGNNRLDASAVKNLPSGGNTDPLSGQTAAQVQTAIRNALDALVGDEQVSIPVRAAGRTYTGARGEDSVTATVVQIDSLLQNRYQIPVNLRSLAAGGESLTLLLTATHSLSSVAGFNPDLELVIQPYVAGSAFGDAHTVNVPPEQNGFPVTWQLPAAFLTEGDPAGKNQALALDVTARVTIRGVRAIGSITLNSAAIHGIGTHEVELEELIKRLIDADVNPIDARLTATDQSLQDQIRALANGTLGDREKRILRLFSLIQDMSFVPYAVQARTGSTGDFGDAATTYTPTGMSVDVLLSSADGVAFGDELVLRQGSNDYSFKGRVRQTTQTNWIYRFTLPSMDQVSFWRAQSEDDLAVLANVRHLLSRAAEVDALLTPAARDLLADVEREQVETQDVERTTLLPALTNLSRATLDTAAPVSTPAIDGGEWLIATRHNEDRFGGGDAVTLVTLFLNEQTQLPFIQSYAGDNGVRYLRLAQLLAGTPAHNANAQVPLHLDSDPNNRDQYSIVLHRTDETIPTDWIGYFAIPSGATGDLTVSVQYFANGNQVDSRNFTASTTEQTYRNPTNTGFTNYTTKVQRQSDGRIRVEFDPDSTLVGARKEVVVRAWYVTTQAIPATSERYTWIGITGNLSSDHLTALFALKVVDGNLHVVTESALRSPVDTGIPASRFGLQSGGTGVLRLSQTVYNEAIHVIAGDVTDAVLRSTLRQQASALAFGLGLFTNVTDENDVYAFDRAIKAPKLLVGDTPVQTTPGSSGAHGSLAITTSGTFTKPTGAYALYVELRDSASTTTNTFIYPIQVPILALPAAGGSKRFVTDTHNPSAGREGDTVGFNIELAANGDDYTITAYGTQVSVLNAHWLTFS